MPRYSRVRASGWANRTPCHPSETCGPETPRPSRNRPPVSTSRLAAVIAAMAGVRAGICITAEPTWILVVCAGEPGEHRGAVGSVCLGRPDHVESELLGMPGQPQLISGIVRADQVSQVETRGISTSRARRP